jgi:hypothetical protein
MNLEIPEQTPARGTVGESYGWQIGATGGAPGADGYSWTLESGALPAGLRLTDSGVINGKPESAGESSVAVKCDDRSTDGSSAIATFTISVDAAGSESSASARLTGDAITKACARLGESMHQWSREPLVS